jgi:hypothetical protein
VSPAKALSSQTRPELAGIDEAALLQSACTAWPVRKAPPSSFKNPVSPVPTLIVQGSLDWAVTPQGIATLQVGLKNAHTVVFSTLGSTLLSGGVPQCLNDLRRSFLADPTRHLDTAACGRQSPPINFVTSTP